MTPSEYNFIQDIKPYLQSGNPYKSEVDIMDFVILFLLISTMVGAIFFVRFLGKLEKKGWI